MDCLHRRRRRRRHPPHSSSTFAPPSTCFTLIAPLTIAIKVLLSLDAYRERQIAFANSTQRTLSAFKLTLDLPSIQMPNDYLSTQSQRGGPKSGREGRRQDKHKDAQKMLQRVKKQMCQPSTRAFFSCKLEMQSKIDFEHAKRYISTLNLHQKVDKKIRRIW